jgi:hypothetical protein
MSRGALWMLAMVCALVVPGALAQGTPFPTKPVRIKRGHRTVPAHHRGHGREARGPLSDRPSPGASSIENARHRPRNGEETLA